MEAYTTMMRRITAIIERADDGKSDIIKEYAWHLTTILNTFNAYHCYNVSLDRQREIEPVWLKMDEDFITVRLLSIMIDSEYKFTFLLEKTDATRLYYSYEAFVRSKPVLTQNEAVYDTRIESQGKLDMISISTSFDQLNDSRLRMPPLYCDLKYGDGKFGVIERDNSYSNFEIYVNLKYLHPSRVLHGADTDIISKNTARGSKLTNGLAYLQDYLFGVDWSYVENNFNGDTYKPRTRIRIDPIEPVSVGVCFRPNGTEKSLLEHDDIPYMDRRNTEVTRMIRQSYTYECLILDITNRLRRINDTDVIPDTISAPSIDPSYRTNDLVTLENRHYDLRHRIGDTAFLINDIISRIERL